MTVLFSVARISHTPVLCGFARNGRELETSVKGAAVIDRDFAANAQRLQPLSLSLLLFCPIAHAATSLSTLRASFSAQPESTHSRSSPSKTRWLQERKNASW